MGFWTEMFGGRDRGTKGRAPAPQPRVTGGARNRKCPCGSGNNENACMHGGKRDRVGGGANGAVTRNGRRVTAAGTSRKRSRRDRSGITPWGAR